MYEVGSRVMYAASGVCDVTDIREETFLGEERTYYVLTPVGTTSSVYVPVDSEVLTQKMRPLSTPDEIEGAVKELLTLSLEWIEDNRARSQHFQTVIASGRMRDLLHLVRTIYLRKQHLLTLGKKNLMADENALKKAEKILFGEIEAVLGIPSLEVGTYLERAFA